MNYTAEADAQTAMAFIDVDNDRDEDMVISYDKTLYLKKQQKTQAEKEFYDQDPETISLDKLFSQGQKLTVEGLSVSHTSNEKVDLRFNLSGDEKDVVAYDLRYIQAMADEYREPHSFENRHVMLIQDQPESLYEVKPAFMLA